MPQNTPQSFIPHEAPTIAGARGRGTGLADLFVLLAIVLFVASAALAAGVFLYQQYLQSSATSKVNQLERAKAAFEPSLIHELTRLDDRMRGAGDVLGRHLAPSAFFRMLEQTTIASISFTSLDFEATDASHMTIKMDGVAGSVNAIALQADLFSKGGMVTSPIFSNIDRESDGVHFKFAALLNPAALNYVQYIASGGGSSTAQPQNPQIQQNQQPKPPDQGGSSEVPASPPASGSSTP